MTRDEALAILHEFTQSDSLRKHALAVEAAMRAYAERRGSVLLSSPAGAGAVAGKQDTSPSSPDYWATVGLLHDFDWEIHPTLDEHPQKGADILRARGVDEALIQDILAHAPHTGVPRDTLLRKTLFAVDELTGFIIACALVRPSKSISDLEAKSVMKKMKDKSFAAAVSRDDLRIGAEELGVDLHEHAQFVIEALRPAAADLGV